MKYSEYRSGRPVAGYCQHNIETELNHIESKQIHLYRHDLFFLFFKQLIHLMDVFISKCLHRILSSFYLIF